MSKPQSDGAVCWPRAMKNTFRVPPLAGMGLDHGDGDSSRMPLLTYPLAFHQAVKVSSGSATAMSQPEIELGSSLTTDTSPSKPLYHC